MSFVVKIKECPSFSVKLGNVSINTSGGYDEGYANGKADAEAADAVEDAALLDEINAAIIAAAENPLSCAETLDDVPESIGKLYAQGYGRGEDAASSVANAELNEVNAVLDGYGQQGASTVGELSDAVAVGLDRVQTEGYVRGKSDGKELGAQEEYDRFWDNMQTNGTRTDYFCAFRYWQDEYFHPKYKVVPTNGMPNSAYAMFQHMTNLKIAEAAYIDLSNVSDTSDTNNTFALFGGCTALEEVENIGLHAGLHYYYTFFKCTNLRTIRKISTNESTRWTFAFMTCTSLENVIFEGKIGQSGLSFSDSPKLSKESIESVIGALSDKSTGKSVTLARAAVTAAYGSVDSGIWLSLIGTKPNWTISLV